MSLQASVHVKDGKVTGAYTAQAKNISYNNTTVANTLDNIKSNEWVVLNSKVKYKVSGGFVYISAMLSNTNNTWASIGTMPEGLRPSNNVYNCCYYRHGTTPTYGNLYCNTSGSIQQFANSDIPNGYLIYPLE